MLKHSCMLQMTGRFTSAMKFRENGTFAESVCWSYSHIEIRDVCAVKNVADQSLGKS